MEKILTPTEMQERINALLVETERLVKDIDLTMRKEEDEERMDAYQVIRERVYMVSKDIEDIYESEFPDYIF